MAATARRQRAVDEGAAKEQAHQEEIERARALLIELRKAIKAFRDVELPYTWYEYEPRSWGRSRRRELGWTFSTRYFPFQIGKDLQLKVGRCGADDIVKAGSASIPDSEGRWNSGESASASEIFNAVIRTLANEIVNARKEYL